MGEAQRAGIPWPRDSLGCSEEGRKWQWGTHSWALLILKHDLEHAVDGSWGDWCEDDWYLDGAEGANLTLCHLRGKRCHRPSQASHFYQGTSPCLHQHEVLVTMSVSVPEWPGPALRGFTAHCPASQLNPSWDAPSVCTCSLDDLGPLCMCMHTHIHMHTHVHTLTHASTHTHHAPAREALTMFSRRATQCLVSRTLSLLLAWTQLGMGVATGQLIAQAA